MVPPNPWTEACSPLGPHVTRSGGHLWRQREEGDLKPGTVGLQRGHNKCPLSTCRCPMPGGHPHGVLAGSSPCYEDEEPETQSRGGGCSAPAVTQWLRFKTRPDSEIHPTPFPPQNALYPQIQLEQDLSLSLEPSGRTTQASGGHSCGEKGGKGGNKAGPLLHPSRTLRALPPLSDMLTTSAYPQLGLQAVPPPGDSAHPSLQAVPGAHCSWEATGHELIRLEAPGSRGSPPPSGAGPSPATGPEKHPRDNGAAVLGCGRARPGPGTGAG